MTTSPPNPRGLGDIIVTSRGFAEYRAMFGLESVDLEGLVILDCPGGASGFPAGGRAAGAQVTSVDPVYAIPPSELIARGRRDTLFGNRYVREHPELYVYEWFRDADDHAERRLASLDAFAADFRGADDRYVVAMLPELPFADRSFDLVLSGHLLFTYPDHLDETAHLAALRELVRVARDHVRVFPLIDTTATPSAYVDGLQRALEADGCRTALERVPYHFQRGAHTVLVIDVPDPASAAQ
jgi:glycine/D-amino acid oxidase-like deaminating enzyme